MSDRIAVVGKMHSGKTTLAESLVSKGYSRIAFADPVKEVSAEMLTTFSRFMGKNEDYVYSDMNRMKGHPSIRALLQLVGTELGRNWMGPQEIWINLFMDIVDDMEEGVKLVNDDCRFVNEANALRAKGFTIIKLHRSEDERVTSILQALKKQNPDSTKREISKALDQMLNHPSETEIDSIDYDYEIQSISVKNLRGQVTDIITGGVEHFTELYNSNVLRATRKKAVDLSENDLSPMKVSYAHGG